MQQLKNNKISYRKQIARQHSWRKGFGQGRGGVVNPVNNFFSSSLITVKKWLLFLVPCDAHMQEVPKNFGAPKKTLLPHLCYLAEFDRSKSSGMSLLTYGDPPKKMTPRVPPFKVTQGHRNRRGIDSG